MDKNGHRYIRNIGKLTKKVSKLNHFKGVRILLAHPTSKVLRSAAFHDRKDNCKPKKPNETKALRPKK